MILALLRGINLGGKNKVPMKDLTGMFVEAGCKNVQTYIQSGNVIFNAAPGVAARLADLISAQIAKRFGYRTPVVLRTRKQLGKVIANNPFLAAGAPEDTLHVMFLAEVPSPPRVASLDPDRSLPDSFVVSGQEVFLRLPNGVARSKLTNAWFDAKLGTVSTGRNWRTVVKLFEMMAE
jgi:uncharacterized protein (DUF1697 family)